jgi:hypothetical protein
MEDSNMDSAARLQLIARVTYYIGWLAALCGAFVHFGLGAAMFRSVDILKRNLFEASVMFFIISIASAARSVASQKN